MAWLQLILALGMLVDNAIVVLENINLEIQPGENVALVGQTGAGKCSIAHA